jgi:hypothetical protein
LHPSTAWDNQVVKIVVPINVYIKIKLVENTEKILGRFTISAVTF